MKLLSVARIADSKTTLMAVLCLRDKRYDIHQQRAYIDGKLENKELAYGFSHCPAVEHTVRDNVRTDAVETVEILNNAGIQVVMVTGDLLLPIGFPSDILARLFKVIASIKSLFWMESTIFPSPVINSTNDLKDGSIYWKGATENILDQVSDRTGLITEQHVHISRIGESRLVADKDILLIHGFRIHGLNQTVHHRKAFRHRHNDD